MHDFDGFCYLDPQKTGSSFVSVFLAEQIATPARSYEKHGTYSPRRGDANKFFFITARDPVSWYKSLYSYGCEGKGGLFQALSKQGLRRFYDGTSGGYAEWASFVLDAQSARALREGFSRVAFEHFGFQTFRFLRLALTDPLRHLRRIEHRDDLVKCWNEHRLPQVVLRQETLNLQLAQLVENELRPFVVDRAAALAALRWQGRITASPTLDIELPADIVNRIEDREWFMFDVLDYPRYTMPTVS